MAQVFNSCCQTDDINWLPLSVVIDSGMPNVEIRPWAKASMTDVAVISFIGIARGQRVRRSTAVSKYLKPLEVGNETISTFQCWNRFEGTVNSAIGGTV